MWKKKVRREDKGQGMERHRLRTPGRTGAFQSHRARTTFASSFCKPDQ